MSLIESSPRPIHITQSEQAARFDSWRNLHVENAFTPPEDPIFSEWEQVIPRDNFGEVDVTKAIPGFEKGFKDALEAGTVSEYVQSTVNPNFDGIYVARTTDLESESDIQVRDNHTPSSLGSIEQRLFEFLKTISTADMPDVYKMEYQRSIENKHLPFIRAAKRLGDVEFTANYKTPTQWREFIDLQKSSDSGTMVLKFEDQAREALRIARERKDKERQDVPVKKALEFWKFSDREKEKIGFDEIDDASFELTNAQTVALFEIALDRLELSDKGWKVVVRENATAVSCETLPREIRVPATRQLKGWDVRNTPVHEPYHAVRGENGRVQGMKMLQEESVDDYLKTEEGSAAVAELVFGQKFGDDRQVVFAGRYLAVAMAMKAQIVDGEVLPQHSIQEIYDTLVQEGMTVIDAKNTVWRIFRGTSLQQKGLLIPVKTENGTEIFPSAECFPKDAAYFEGQMEVFNWIKKNMLVAEGQRAEVFTEALDFSDKLLARVGRASEIYGMNIPIDEEDNVRYEVLVKKGQMVLISLLNKLGRGKMRLDFLDKDSEWRNLLVDQGTIDFSKILEPKE